MEKIAVSSIILQQVFMISSSHFSTAAPEISVKWKVITSPVVFGEPVTLECKVTRNDKQNWTGLDKFHFEWTGGKGNKILCRDGSKCIDGNKYNMMTDQREKKSKLEILEFMESDLDYEYTCSFEYKTFTKRLTLNLLEFNIIKPPINDASLESVFTEDGFLFITMTLENVYPKPICFVNFMYRHKHTLSEQLLNVSTSQNGPFFNAHLEGRFKLPVATCQGQSVISCDFGLKKYPVLIAKIDNCTSQEKENRSISENTTTNTTITTNKEEIPTNNIPVNNVISDTSVVLLSTATGLVLLLFGFVVLSAVVLYIKKKKRQNSLKYDAVNIDIEDIEAPIAEPAAEKIETPQLISNKKRKQRTRYRRRKTNP